MPNGTWDNRSGVCHAATKNDTFIPAQSKIWLCGLGCFDEREANFFEDIVSESALVWLLYRSTPYLPLRMSSKSQNAFCHLGTDRALSAQEQDAFLHLILSFLCTIELSLTFDVWVFQLRSWYHYFLKRRIACTTLRLLFALSPCK